MSFNKLSRSIPTLGTALALGLVGATLCSAYSRASSLPTPPADPSNTPVIDKVGFELDAPKVETTNDGRYIYYKYSMVQMSVKDRKEVVDQAVLLLQHELKDNLANKHGFKTFANTLASPSSIAQLETEAEQAVDFSSTKSFRGLFPAAFVIYFGGDVGGGILATFGLSGDLGMVFLPQKWIQVDTETGEAKESWHLDHAIVLVPHVHVGLGAGAGGSFSIGAGLIFGKMASAKDFAGPTLALSADARVGLGLDGQANLVYNTKKKMTMMFTGIEFDAGAEASAKVDGEAGEVYTFDEVMTLIDAQIGSPTPPQSSDSGNGPTDPSVTPTPTPSPSPSPSYSPTDDGSKKKKSGVVSSGVVTQ